MKRFSAKRAQLEALYHKVLDELKRERTGNGDRPQQAIGRHVNRASPTATQFSTWIHMG